MSKIYIVVSSQGSYDDYCTYNEKAFVNRKDAEEFAKKLDIERGQKPDFATSEWENAYWDVACDYYEDPEWYDYPITEKNRQAYKEFCQKCEKEYIQHVIDKMYQKGFMLTTQMYHDYEKYQSELSKEWHNCTIEEIDLV